MSVDIARAVEILHKGGLVAMPTETVYGLAADARNQAALMRIFAAKGRPIDHPLIVHIGDIAQLSSWATDISSAAMRLAETFWPGPMTLILNKAPGVLDIITGGQQTIGVRIPNHPMALALLKAFGGGVAAPSANRFGRISPTTADAVREELGTSVDLILEGGQCAVGVESTIVDMTGEHPVILRPGMLSGDQIAAVLHEIIADKQVDSPRVSGSLESHYAPVTKTRLMGEVELREWVADHQDDPSWVVIGRHRFDVKNSICMSGDPNQYAHDLYQTLRLVDQQGYSQIMIEEVPGTKEWDAIRDRLRRAAGI